MLSTIQKWYKKTFSDPEAVILFILLVGSFLIIMLLGKVFVPVLASIVISYLLQWLINGLTKRKVSYLIAYLLVYFSFLAIFVASILLLLPMLWKQLSNVFTDLPNMLEKFRIVSLKFIEKYPDLFSSQQFDSILSSILAEGQNIGKVIFSASLSSIPSLILWMVYIVLIPMIVFFLLKDKDAILKWVSSCLPKERKLLTKVWKEMDLQIGNYVRGKVTEIIIVGFFTYLIFWSFSLNYAVLLSSLVGLSVVIPYVGAVVVTIPVILVGFFQYGFTDNYAYMIGSYFLIQVLDGNLLVPLLFSEAVNLHPIAIIVAILGFGALWGFWGVFFAIPLATLVRAVLNSWPKIA